ncbi:hypothetical protein C0993_008148, partial [Termitomyces sp. T159_Od127]
MREVAPQAQYEMGTEVLLQCLEAVGQPVPSTALFLQNNLAVMVMEGLLDQIELMQKQHISALEQIDHATKCKLLSPKETISLPRHGLPAMSQAPDALGPAKTHQGQKPPLVASQLETVDFPANIPEQAEAAQMLFMKSMVFLAPAEQVVVVVLLTDPYTPAQYDGIIATTAAKKGKYCETPPVNNNSNYRELQSEEDEDEEEGKTPAQHFQYVQQNKKIAKKKVNKAKAAAALAHQVQNNFSGHILNRLG